MKRLQIWGEPSGKQLDETVSILKDGGLIIYPTDSLYAIGCDMMNKAAVDNLCRLKEKSEGKTPLSLICSDISMASDYTLIDNRIFRVLKGNTPGPFTFIIKGTARLPKTLRGRKELGIRIPDNATARSIVEALGNPMLSASLDYDEELAGDDPEIAAMPYEHTAELLLTENHLTTTPSTVVDCRDGSTEIIRQGLGILSVD